MAAEVPSIEVTDRAKERLREALAGEPRARFVRIGVGRSRGGYACDLSLDETAGRDDATLDVDGIPFVAEGRFHLAISGLKIDVQEIWGYESLVAYRPGLDAAC